MRSEKLGASFQTRDFETIEESRSSDAIGLVQENSKGPADRSIKRRPGLLKRLPLYTMPDFIEAEQKREAGLPIATIWRRYAANAPAPLAYSSFAARFQTWREQKARNDKGSPARSRIVNREIAPGIPDYAPIEYQLAEEYWDKQQSPITTILVLTGFCCSLSVKHGMLTAYDGGKITTFEPVSFKLSLIVIGPGGATVSTRAIEWCERRNVGIVVLDYDGTMVSITRLAGDIGTETRRAQFHANELEIAKRILKQKLAATYKSGKQSEFSYGLALTQIKNAMSVDALIATEGKAAMDYWKNMAFPLKYDPKGWPQSWSEFSGRISSFSGETRHASHPVNAILNYAYAIVAGMCVRALVAVGFDPCYGFLHVNKGSRYSLAYDLMELMRAKIDHEILTWVAQQKWRRAHFPVTPSGIVRLHPSLTRVVVQRTCAGVTMEHVVRAAEWLRERIMTGTEWKIPRHSIPNAKVNADADADAKVNVTIRSRNEADEEGSADAMMKIDDANYDFNAEGQGMQARKRPQKRRRLIGLV